MVDPSAKAANGRSELGRSAFYVSTGLIAEARHAGSVHVDVSIDPAWIGREQRRQANAALLLPAWESDDATGIAAAVAAVREALERSFTAEIGKVVDAYRVMLRESLAKGEDPGLQAALNRARLQEKILAGASMVDQAQACRLLGLSDANPSATMKRKEDRKEILRFTIDGRPGYPLFQFDVEGRRIFPAMARLIARKPGGWSDFRLLHWLTRPDLDLDGPPAGRLGKEEDAVVAAFDREIEPAAHG